MFAFHELQYAQPDAEIWKGPAKKQAQLIRRHAIRERSTRHPKVAKYVPV